MCIRPNTAVYCGETLHLQVSLVGLGTAEFRQMLLSNLSSPETIQKLQKVQKICLGSLRRSTDV